MTRPLFKNWASNWSVAEIRGLVEISRYLRLCRNTPPNGFQSQEAEQGIDQWWVKDVAHTVEPVINYHLDGEQEEELAI